MEERSGKVTEGMGGTGEVGWDGTGREGKGKGGRGGKGRRGATAPQTSMPDAATAENLSPYQTPLTSAAPRYSCLGSGASIPLTPWSKFPPPLPLLSPFPSPPLPSHPSPPLRSKPPLLRLGGLGERFRPSGSGQSPATKRYLVNFRLKISPLVATNFRSFSEINHSVFAET